MSELIQGIYTDLSGVSTLLPVAVDAAGRLLGSGGGGGGGGGTATSSTDIAIGIDQSIDVEAIKARLISIDGKTAVGITVAGVTTAINDAVDIDTLISAIAAIRDRTPVLGAAAIAQSQPVSIASDQVVNVRDRSTTTPTVQTSIVLAAGGTNQFVIPATARSLTICITSGGLVHYTENGDTPTTANCWFAGGSKEIWDYAVPAGATLKLLAVSAATISIQVRV